ncbi:biopolymer transporter ExbD [Mesorhizobium sp. WSM2239]|uniref:Biopolymer transporter ExbD n=2 Tax=unclassified Mesorhizobium TaxID=325217 RepID=A0AAU8DIN2_9HYPH
MNYIPSRPKRRRPDFSLAVINIVFLLLLFYLATGRLITQGELMTDVPLTQHLPLDHLPRPLLLVTADGSLFLDGAPVSMDALPGAARKAADNSQFLNILAERTVQADKFVDILARINTANVPVRIVTLHAQGRSAGKAP